MLSVLPGEQIVTPRPTLLLVSTQTAVTYAFRATGGDFGWASCTINDATGELLITSDWGNWSHRWDPRPSCLGAPSLTVFIGTRSDGDYLARKLQRDRGSGQRWSPVATATALRRQLCRQRLEDGRDQLQNRLETDDERTMRPGFYDDEGLPLFSYRHVDAPTWYDPHRRERLPYLTRDAARQLWAAIGCTANDIRNNADLFYERVLQIDSFADYVTEEPWEYGETEQTLEDRILRESVLPALITACRDRAHNPSASESLP
jgi:hypothetical protein